MNYLSVCSGIEAATVAWHPLGWNPVGFGEIEKFPSQVLKHHYPSVPNFGDMTKFKEWQIDSAINVLVGGTPCQSFSVAGLRKGLDDPRGNLMLTYLAIAAKYRPKWLVWENVPGVLSSNGGLDFASLLRGMGELGYGFAYRVLDVQYFGVAQRRRRVFVVGHLGNWQRAAAVLFERHSLCRYPAPSREKGQGVAPSVTTGAPFSGTGNDRVEAEAMVVWPATISSTLDTTFGTKMGLENQHVNAGCPMFVPAYTFSTPAIGHIVNDNVSSTITKNTGGGGETQNPAYVMQPIALAENTIGRKPENGGNGDGFTENGPMYTLNATGVHGVAQPISFDLAQITSKINRTKVEEGLPVSTLASGSQMHVAQPIPIDTMNHISRGDKHSMGDFVSGAPSYTLTKGHSHAVAQPMVVHGTQDPCVSDIAFAQGRNNGGENVMVQSMAVRRLTPMECERLQGFPDGYTDIKHGGKQTPDGPRYKALGNSMAVPVMAWIGQRIEQVENIL